METKSLITLAKAVIRDGGRANETDSLTIPLPNVIGLLNHTLLVGCVGQTLDKCWCTYNPSSEFYTEKSPASMAYVWLS